MPPGLGLLQRLLGDRVENGSRDGLLQALVTRILTFQAFAAVVVSDHDLNQARLDLLEEKGYDGMEQWPQLLEGHAGTEPDLMTALNNKFPNFECFHRW